MILPHTIGIDPGVTGALAVFTPEAGVAVIADTPNLQQRIGKMNATVVNAEAFAGLFIGLVNLYAVTRVCIEDVHTMPSQGVVTSGRLMEAFGIAKGLTVGLELELVLVRPSEWKPAMGLSREKQESLVLARRLFPMQGHMLARAKDHNRAEAALLAWYGARVIQ